jgi:MFS family permease
MMASRTSSNERNVKARVEVEARVKQQRQRPIPARLSTRNNRRSLALLPAAIFILGVLAAVFGSGTVGLVFVLLFSLGGAAGVLLLRRVTQMVDTAPLALLDEREIAQRNHGHQRAFQWGLILIGALWVLAVVDHFTASTFQFIADDGWIYVLLASLVSASMLPAAVLAWSWKAPQGIDDLEH